MKGERRVQEGRGRDRKSRALKEPQQSVLTSWSQDAKEDSQDVPRSLGAAGASVGQGHSTWQ